LLTAAPALPSSAAEVDDPMARLALAFDESLGVTPPTVSPGASVVALVGDLQLAEAKPLLESELGGLRPARADLPVPKAGPRERQIDLEVAVAQAGLGYVVLAPPPSDPDWLAWRILLYVLSHGYEGRLGVEAISRRGLVYYIDAQYLSDGSSGRVSLAIGVDPAKLEAMQKLMQATLNGLAEKPPTDAEVEEAKSYLLGRRLTAAQSNAEVSAELIEDWVGHGRLPSDEEFAKAVDAVSSQDVKRVIPAFLAGATITVTGAE
jgi:zinc protease